MKKVLFISLLLVVVFLIGSAGAQADFITCSDFIDYSCSVTKYGDGEIEAIFTDCVTLCYDDSFFVGISDAGGSDFFSGYLYPATSYEHLLGTTNTGIGWAGCSVDFKGRTIIVRLSFIEDDDGQVSILSCTPCNNCCRPE